MPLQLIIGAAIVAAAFLAGWQVNGWRIHASEARAEAAAERGAQAATEAAVTAIKAIEIKYTTIKQKAEVITREVPVYSDAGCQHDPRGLRLLNEALTGHSPPAGDPPRLPGP